jgi:hypothetical protein
MRILSQKLTATLRNAEARAQGQTYNHKERQELHLFLSNFSRVVHEHAVIMHGQPRTKRDASHEWKSQIRKLAEYRTKARLI